MVTIDADGQHNPRDIEKFLPLIKEDDTDIIIGCRNFNTENVPIKSRFGRKFANFWLRVETGIYIDDCQSGFRAYPVRYLNQLKLKVHIMILKQRFWQRLHGPDCCLKQLVLMSIIRNPNSAYRVLNRFSIICASQKSMQCSLVEGCCHGDTSGWSSRKRLILKYCVTLANY